MNCRHNSCAPNNLPLAEGFQECCLEKYPTHVLLCHCKRLRNVAANHALAMKPKEKRKPMYPMTNAIWYFAVP